MMNASRVIALLLVISPGMLAETITFTGSVKDKATLLPVDSAVVEIVNAVNPAERFSVVTNPTGVWSYSFDLSGVIDNPSVPATFSVEQNYPNPFNPSTKIEFATGRAGDVVFTIYTSLGQQLDTKTFSVPAGNHTVDWSSKGAAGVLFYSVEFGGLRITRKMVQMDGHGSGGIGRLVTFGGRSTVPSMQKTASATYLVIASQLLYMPDTVTTLLSGSAVIDFALETVHSRAFVIDLHNDVLEIAINGGYDLGVRHTYNHSDLPRFREGGFDAQMFAIWTDWRDSAAHPYYSYTLAMVDTFNSNVLRNSETFAQARSFDELMQVNASGKFGGVLAVEGGHAIENSIDKLKDFYALGARYFTITWNNSLSWAVSAADSRSTTVGLSEFGRQVVRTMDSLGMIIDVAHTGIKTIWDILATTRNPIIDSHAGVRALNNSSRNLTDAQIDSIASRGGVIGVVFYPSFLSPKGVATIEDVIKHIDYIRDLVGIDYVAIGSDYDGIGSTPAGLEDVSKLPNLTAALRRHGYSREDVIKILGGNYLRVFKQVCR
jgi:membrane dipeptidase